MIETDKSSRDVRHGATRLLRQIKQSEKYNHKERIKKLSALNRASSSNEANYEMMGCDVVERADVPCINGSAISKKFKLPRKQFFDVCNGVDQVPVPRKLRSAMKKRNRESISPPFPDSKKVNPSTGGVESPKKIGIKKSKLNLKQGGPNWSTKHSVGASITKDEEEVVETLYALAGMFPDNELDSKTIVDGASLDASPSGLPEVNETPPPKLEEIVGIKEDLNAICLARTDEAVNPASDVEVSHEESSKVNSVITPSICGQSHFPSPEALRGDPGSPVTQVNPHKMFIKHEEQKTPCDKVNYCFPPDTHQYCKVQQCSNLEISLLDRKSETAVGLTSSVGCQLDQRHLSNESKRNGSALWPGLSLTVSSTYCHWPLSQSLAKIPTKLGQGPVQCDSSTRKVYKVSADRRSWKRCATHVYISHLIRALEIPESRERLQLPQTQLRPHEIIKQGVLMTINNFNGKINDLNAATSGSNPLHNTQKNLAEAKSGNLQHLRLQQNQPQPALSSSLYTTQKQSCNFLSLSSGGCLPETNTSCNGAGNSLEPLTQLQVPNHSQQPTLVPFSMSQALYTSAYPDQPPTAAAQQAQLQLPPYFNGPYGGTHASPKALTRQQQQRCLRVAQCRNTGNSTSITQFPSWQNGRQHSPALMPYISPPPATLEVLGPKYPQIYLQQQQQQQQFTAITLPHTRMKRQDHHLSSVYDENGVRFRAGGGALPLQLLCNERL